MLHTYMDMVDSKVNWIGNIPSSWQQKRGKFVFSNEKQINNGLIEPQRLALTLNGVVERTDGDSLGLNPQSLESYQLFKKGDLVFKLIDLENKKTSRVGLVPKDGIMSPAYIRITPIKKICSKYFYYYYYLLYLTYVFNNIAGEGVRANLSARELLELDILIPDYDSQQKIADFLDTETAKIDNLIAKQEKLLQLLEEKRRATITHAVTRGLNPNVALKQTNIPWLGQIPAHWELEKIKYITIKRDQKISTTNLGVKYIGLEHVLPFMGEEVSIRTDAEPEGLVLKYEEGDVLFSKLRPYLTKAIKTIDTGVCSSEFIVLNSTLSKITPDYLLSSMLNDLFIDEVNASTYGSKMPRANWESISNIFLLLPPLYEQKLINKYLAAQHNKTKSLKQEIQAQIYLLKERRNSLISHAVTGKIKV